MSILNFLEYQVIASSNAKTIFFFYLFKFILSMIRISIGENNNSLNDDTKNILDGNANNIYIDDSDENYNDCYDIKTTMITKIAIINR